MAVVERQYLLWVETKNEEGADPSSNKRSDIAYHLEIGGSLADLISRQNGNADQGWPSGLGSELIIRLRQVRLLYPGLTATLTVQTDLAMTARDRPQFSLP